MMFAAAVGHRSGRATPSLRGAPQRQSMEIVPGKPSIGTETLFRQTRPPLPPMTARKRIGSTIGSRDNSVVHAHGRGMTSAFHVSGFNFLRF